MKLTRKARIALAPQDRKNWSKLFKKHIKEYERKRLRAIQLLWDGHTQNEVSKKLNCSKTSLNDWIDSYLSGGFSELLKPWDSGRKGKGQLSRTQEKILRYIILYKSPFLYGYNSGLWTLSLLSDLLKKKWNITLKLTQISTILKENLGLSHQKYHQDYKEANKKTQRAFVRSLKDRQEQSEQSQSIWFDEFGISTRTDAAYGWAVRNSSATVASRQKKENEPISC